MTDFPDFLARNLVRTYSDKLKYREETDIKSPSQKRLEEAFCEEVEHQDELAALLQQEISNQNRDASKKLRAQYEELEVAFQEFQTAFPELSGGREPSHAMSWGSLHQAVAKLKAQHESKNKKGMLGETKRRFHRICEVIDSHSNVLKILPQGDKYTSLVCGSLEMIVKASVNHEQIGQDFSTALEEIDDIVAQVRNELAVYQAEASHLKDLSIRLCCKILAFMSFPLKWYSQKKRNRIKSSFNENLSKEYKAYIDEIRRISSNIQRGFQYCAARELKEFRSTLERVKYHQEIQEEYQRKSWKMYHNDWEHFNSAQKEHNLEMRKNGQQYLTIISHHLSGMFDNIGGPMKQILDREAENFATRRLEASPAGVSPSRSIPSGENIQESALPQTLGTADAAKVRENIENASEVLNPHFDFDHFIMGGSEINNYVETEAIQRLQLWTEQNYSGVLGIFGPASISQDSSTRLLASNYIRAAKASGIPCVSYFCVTGSDTPPEGRLRETIGLVSLLYGLIKQLILHLPLRIDSRGTILDTRQFERLDGTLRTWEPALSLFKNLLNLIEPPILLVAIHGLEMLEHEATKKFLTEIVGVLKKISQGQEDIDKPTGKVFKVFLTTCGISQVLMSQLEVDEILDLNRGSVAGGPGHAKKGRNRMDYLSYAHPYKE